MFDNEKHFTRNVRMDKTQYPNDLKKQNHKFYLFRSHDNERSPERIRIAEATRTSLN